MLSLVSRLDRALEIVVLCLLGLLISMALGETLGWILLQISIPQVAEIESVLLAWFALLSAAWAVPRGLHLALDWLPESASPGLRRWLDRFVHLATVTFGAALALYGWALSGSVSNTLPATGAPASLQYYSTAVAGGLIALFATARLMAPTAGDAARD